MAAEKFALKDWHIPFMLFELSSYVQNKELRQQRQNNDELLTEMNGFFHDDKGEEAMDLFWENLRIGDDYHVPAHDKM